MHTEAPHRAHGRLPDSPFRDRPVPVYPLLLAAYAVLFLYGQNLGELRPADLGPPLVGVVVAALVVLVVGAYVMGDGRRAALIVGSLTAVLLFYGHAADVLQPFGVRVGFQQVGWAAVLIVVVIVALRIGSFRLAGLTRALNLMTALLVAFALVAIVPAELSRFGRTTTAAGTVGGSGGPARDIYFLIFDRYGSARSLESLYGIDDRPFIEGLRSRGFQIAPDSHANYVKTSLSLAATLNLDYLDDLVAAQDPSSDDHGPIDARLSNHGVGRFLRDRGYRYVHVGSYFGPTRTSELADRNLEPGGPSDFMAALYDASVLPAIARRIGATKATPARERHHAVGRFQLDTLDRLAADPGPMFVFAHLLLPHPPYTFASDGSFVTDEGDAGRGQREGFAQQLEYLQTRIDTLVDSLLARPEADRPIIILQGDEGPYPPPYAGNTIGYDWATATSDELEIKFGILNAMYLPGEDAPTLSPTLSSVNTFRLILDAYFGADLPLLPDRSFTSAGKFRPYDLTDITDRLSAGEPP